jgi:hypothetical protein
MAVGPVDVYIIGFPPAGVTGFPGSSFSWTPTAQE